MTRDDYEDRQDARKDRLLARAAKAEQEAKAAEAAAQGLAGAIPMGQPILVGHHSERRHRRDLERIDRGFRKAFEKAEEAKELQRRAGAIGQGGISSDDPEAVQKLLAKLEDLERRREWGKKLNAAWRDAGQPEPSDSEGWTRVGEALGATTETLSSMRLEMARRWHYQPTPSPAYALSNLSAEVRRIKKRIEALRKAESRHPTEVDHGICRVLENVDMNRIQFLFEGKPPAETRALLKSWGFRWSPSEGAWQRHLNDAGRSAAGCILDKLKGGQP